MCRIGTRTSPEARSLDGVGADGVRQNEAKRSKAKKAKKNEEEQRKAKKRKEMGRFPPTILTPTPARTSKVKQQLQEHISWQASIAAL